MRCHDTYYHHGINLQCEGDEGHTSAHWNGDVWWGNDDGFPEHLPKIEHKFWFGLAAAGAIIFVAFVYWLYR